MVATPHGGRDVLVGRTSAEGNGPLSTAGILLLSGTAVTSGGSGPRVVLHDVHGVTTKRTLPVPVAPQFGVTGPVRFQAGVTSS
ncbi:hypothetical protein [Streptomyces sp. NBC_00996]|uniref:hypothetical protein n=1 Tax=Streptomyces sp. NBC_00996 TaxID=2903710 RepID=UPI003867C0FE|nr:hypothetical protein OG390_01645 [Streptomyces sp. NBC_00996]